MAQTVARINVKRVTAPKTAQRTEIQPSPVVKWVGGKTRLLSELTKRRPESYRRYFEPFVGGGALFFRLAPGDAVLSDQNADLMNVYECVAWNVEAVIKRLRVHVRKHCSEHYYATRDRWNRGPAKQSEVARAAAFIYMNKTCFNGLWRVNSRGGFNVPMGRYVKPAICEAEKLRVVSRALQKARLEIGSYADAVDDAASGDFVYFDPPYHPLTQTANFTSYTKQDFGPEDQEQLAAVFRDLSNRGVHVMLSNSDTKFIRGLYKGFRIDRVSCSRAINSKASARGPVNEVIVTNR